jgi:ubiquinone/menaquinone biosynthesis C-methylase UbiE
MFKEDIKESYDSISNIYSEKTDKNIINKKKKDLIREFKKTLNKNSLILDAGCGQNPININNMKTIGIDISKEQLENIKINKETAQGDISHLPFKKNSFDGLIAFHSLIHIPLEEHQKVCHEFKRVLRPNCYSIITEGTTQWCGEQEDWMESGKTMKWQIAGEEKTKTHLENAGFKIIDIKHIPDNLSEKEENTKPFFLVQNK